MLKKKKNKKAFTLIELIVVIAIIGVLVAILVPVMSSFVGSATGATAKANARTIYGIAQAQAQFILASGGSVSAGTYSQGQSTEPLISSVRSMVTGSAAVGDYKIVVGANSVVNSVTYFPTAGSTSSPAIYP